ncbi:hypothetical protein A3F65_03300 [Candidatus Saccharibacteria bacterium RIFCSPHIGHO2_12_FULL_47_16b]|nr:MAG: hypothetical protein A3F65_03300 [Candidatus Saccharibacteria bacterium RIFCSPHIGHO2_12_FULL_47_16b]OGL39866.1 MAG: hypothetical protein A3J32_02570 [Candidatus Saccharibacteria bacterium RIFCSPLOWO2_02_FULL_46_7]
MTLEMPFGENPFVNPEADTLGPDDWGIEDWLVEGLPTASERLGLIKGGLGPTGTETTLVIDERVNRPTDSLNESERREITKLLLSKIELGG